METDADKLEARREDRRELWREVAGIVVRFAIALPLIFLTYPRFGLFGPFLIVIGCIVIASDAATFVLWLVVSVFRGERRPARGPLYKVAEALVMKGHYAEAEAEYMRIAAAFPDELTPHADLITLAVVHLDDAELAAKFYERGMAALSSQARRDALRRIYPEILSRRERHDLAKRPG